MGRSNVNVYKNTEYFQAHPIFMIEATHEDRFDAQWARLDAAGSLPEAIEKAGKCKIAHPEYEWFRITRVIMNTTFYEGV